MIKTDLFVVTMYWGLCEQYIKSLVLTPPGFDFLFRNRLRVVKRVWRTDRRIAKQTDWTINKAAWSQLTMHMFPFSMYFFAFCYYQCNCFSKINDARTSCDNCVSMWLKKITNTILYEAWPASCNYWYVSYTTCRKDDSLLILGEICRWFETAGNIEKSV